MIPTTPHVTLSEEADKRETTICIVWASVVVFGMLALLLHGMAFMSWTEETNEEIYRNKRIENRVKQLEEKVIGLNHLWAETQNLHDNHKNHVHPETNKGFTQGMLYY